MSKINSRAKGARAEREAAKFLTANGIPSERGQQRSGSPDSPDIKNLLDVGIHWECKRVEAGNPYVWLDQATKDAGGQRIPVVIHRRNNRPWIVVLDAAAFCRILLESLACQNAK